VETSLTSSPVLDRSQRAELAKAARREEILMAARRVFAERGFSGTTIADIAEAANIALGTIYLYFPSKEAVFAALNQQLAELITAAVTDVPEPVSLEETVRRRVGQVFDVCAGNRELVRLVVINSDPETEVTRRMRAADEDRNRPLTKALTRAMDAGAIRHGDASIVAKLVQGLVTIAVYQAFVVAGGEDADTYRDYCADMIIAYLTPQSGVEENQDG